MSKNNSDRVESPRVVRQIGGGALVVSRRGCGRGGALIDDDDVVGVGFDFGDIVKHLEGAGDADGFTVIEVLGEPPSVVGGDKDGEAGGIGIIFADVEDGGVAEIVGADDGTGDGDGLTDVVFGLVPGDGGRGGGGQGGRHGRGGIGDGNRVCEGN